MMVFGSQKTVNISKYEENQPITLPTFTFLKSTIETKTLKQCMKSDYS